MAAVKGNLCFPQTINPGLQPGLVNRINSLQETAPIFRKSVPCQTERNYNNDCLSSAMHNWAKHKRHFSVSNGSFLEAYDAAHRGARKLCNKFTVNFTLVYPGLLNVNFWPFVINSVDLFADVSTSCEKPFFKLSN
jgi:hypothetical protein